jgi:RND family efflux transporter MFP subunit
LAIVGGVAAILATGFLLVHRAEGGTNKVALASAPQPVGIVRARASTYRASRTYGGTFESWIEAGVGPQRVSAYVDTVLVRPGAAVARGEVLATLDCRSESAESRSLAQRARSLAARQQAVASEAARLAEVQKKGPHVFVGTRQGTFVSENEVEQALARSGQEEANVSAERAKLAALSVAVDDCILRAPFAGEVAARHMDPGGFARPGSVVVTVVDRTTVRFAADVPEADYGVVAPSSSAHLRVDALGLDLDGVVARRSPNGDAATRTVRFEIDVPNQGHAIPANTTGEVRLFVGEPAPSTELPLVAASITGKTATVFVVDGGVAHTRTFHVLGELGGSLFIDPSLVPGTALVVSGRALLADGDRVAPTELAP